MRQAEKCNQDIRNIFWARELVTAAALLISLFVTYKLWNEASDVAQQTVRTSFSFRVREADNRIQQRTAIYEQVLRATAGLFVASQTITRNEFHAFLEELGLALSYPGIQGVGFSVLIPPSQLQQHVASVRREGFPDYDVWPAGQREMYTSIIYLEPFAGKNLRAFGFDMYSEPIRRAAMEQARDTGIATASGKVTLVQEGGREVQAGFLMYLPLYRKDAPHETVEQRRANLAGWVYAPFRMNDFMEGILGEHAEDLDIEVYDGDTVSASARMFDSSGSVDDAAAGKLRSVNRIDVSNHTWTVVTTALPAFHLGINSEKPQLILHAGISISLMIALLIWLFLDDRARALHAANQAMRLALYDALTGLPNRKLLDERLAQALVHAKRSHGHIALLFIDLDKFKPVNDNFGHAYGDLLLKEVANRLHSCMRESDTASRLGGDEFVALLLDIEGPQAVLVVATKILHQLTEPYEIAGHTFDISASIGAALYPEHGSDGKSLMKSADMAMYEAKNSGRGNVKFAPAAAA